MAEILTGQCLPVFAYSAAWSSNRLFHREKQILSLTKKKKRREKGDLLALPFRSYSFFFQDLFIYAFIKPQCTVMAFIKSHLGQKTSHLQQERKAWAMRALSLSHCTTRGSWLHHLFLPLVMVRFCATQCEEGGWGGNEGPQRANPAGKSELFLSLCVIQYHACVPMNGCQDIWVQSQGTGHGSARLQWGLRGWGGMAA